MSGLLGNAQPTVRRGGVALVKFGLLASGAGQAHSTKTLTLAARPAASMTVSVE